LRRTIIVLAALLPLLAACKPQDSTPADPTGSGKNAFKTVCKEDIAKFCANETKARRCLKQNLDKLSDTCKTAIKKKKHGEGKKKNKSKDKDQDSTDE
jgi:hypothetical protein